jgi:hypothetical protein
MGRPFVNRLILGGGLAACTVAFFVIKTVRAQSANENPGAARQYAVLKRSPDRVSALPADVYLRGLAKMATMPSYSTALGNLQPAGSAVSSVTVTSPAAWEWLGPNDVAGRTRAFLPAPAPTFSANGGTFYAAGIDGGVWQGMLTKTNAPTPTPNWSASWQLLQGGPTPVPIPNMAVSSLAFDPSNNVLAGTGEGFYNNDAIQGNGIYLWAGSSLGWQNSGSSQINPDFYFVNRLVRVGTTQVMYAGTRTGLQRSLNGGSTWQQVFNGVFRHSSGVITVAGRSGR